MLTLRQIIIIGAASLLVSGSVAFAQIAYPPGGPLPEAPSAASPLQPSVPGASDAESGTTGRGSGDDQRARDERFPADRDPRVVPVPIPPPASAPNIDR